MLVKDLGHYFTFEVEVLDDQGEHRRFRASNYQVRRTRRRTGTRPAGEANACPRVGRARWGPQNTTRVKDYICTMPLKLESGWNQVQLNLADLTKYAHRPKGRTRVCICPHRSRVLRSPRRRGLAGARTAPTLWRRSA